MISQLSPNSVNEPACASPAVSSEKLESPAEAIETPHAFLSRSGASGLEEVERGARRGARPRNDPHLIRGSFHIERDGRSYDIRAVRVLPGASPAALRALRAEGFIGPMSTNAGSYFLDGRDSDLGFARLDMVRIMRDGVGLARFHN